MINPGRWLRRLALIMVPVPIGLVFAAMDAAAAETASVLITDPATRRTASAFVGDPRYRGLAAAIGHRGAALPTAGESPPSGFGAIFRSDLRIIWLDRDAQVWRIDLIFVVRDSVWVATSRGWIAEPDQAVWRPAADPILLREILAEAGLRPASSRNPSPSSGHSGTPSVGPDGALPFGPAGAALGVAGGILATLLVSRKARHTRGSGVSDP